MNLELAAASGRSIILDFDNLSEDKIVTALNELISNPKYRENAKAIAERFHDRPMTPQQTVVYWTEYAVRHQGADFLSCVGNDLNFVQFHNVDVYCIMFIILLIVMYINYSITRAIFRRIFAKSSKKIKVN